MVHSNVATLPARDLPLPPPPPLCPPTQGPQYGAKDALCSFLVPQPAGQTRLEAFANWTNTHYGPSFGASCYYSTKCLSDPTMADQWPNQRPWVYQCCAELAYWQVRSALVADRTGAGAGSPPLLPFSRQMNVPR